MPTIPSYSLKHNQKWLKRLNRLYVFEGISDLTINLAKSKLVPLNLDEDIGSYYVMCILLS
jgi:hypothetical protein